LFVLSVCIAVAGCGVTAPRRSEGFADLQSLGAVGVHRTMTLSFGPALLHFAANHIDDDPETARLLKELDGVRIRIYRIDSDPVRVATRMEDMAARLQSAGWEPVLLVRGKQDQVHMLLKSRAGLIRGLTLLTSDGEAEAVVINLMGTIQPAQFRKVMLALDIDAPGMHELKIADAAN